MSERSSERMPCISERSSARMACVSERTSSRMACISERRSSRMPYISWRRPSRASPKTANFACRSSSTTVKPRSSTTAAGERRRGRGRAAERIGFFDFTWTHLEWVSTGTQDTPGRHAQGTPRPCEARDRDQLDTRAPQSADLRRSMTYAFTRRPPHGGRASSGPTPRSLGAASTAARGCSSTSRASARGRCRGSSPRTTDDCRSSR